ncbi:TonB-dependent receptor domain-containing protein [Arachidicoccus soli]|uniref:TonB-dependent receptor n=1 Tax=Arachidicoccus soli TaxID=2341117 RepID=A0A386HUD1_9BACT|nr:TonB-dependent receptor [Arachidicoccus soli]AYD49131.1 TonB-dependent receptor [Arachidicoccus soli]
MKKHFTLILVLIIAAKTIVKAQTKNAVNVLGKVVDESKEPLNFAGVYLLNAKDSSFLKAGMTDSSGIYQFSNIPAGKLMVSATIVGHQKTYSAPFEASRDNSKIELPIIVLKNITSSLKDVNVTASKPFLEQKVDKLVVNVEGSVVSAGNNVLEILQKVPGVMVDDDGNISLRGKSGITIMINGKLTYLSQDQLTQMLKSMDASQLSQIEIITNPSAKYDAAGTAGIINIKLKKNMNEGFNGSIQLGYSQAVHSRNNEGLNFNYKKGKFNAYGSYNLYKGTNGHEFNLIRKFYNTDGTPNLIMEQHSPRNSKETYQSFRAGVDYSIDSKNTVGVMANGSFSNGKDQSSGPIKFFNGSYQLDSVAVPETNSKNHWQSVGYNLNYKLQIDTTGQELTASFDYSTYNSRTFQNFNTGYQNTTGDSTRPTQFRKGELPSKIIIKSGKIDYTLPLGKTAKFEAGMKSSIVTSDNNVAYQDLLNGNWQNDAGATNHFIYNENINAVYANFNKDFGKGWSLEAGLRGEQTISKANQVTIDSVVTRNYFQLFPSIFLKKDIGKNNSLNLSYSRRVDRPDYGELNPFNYYIDDYTYSQGNPFLQPQFTNSFEVSDSYKGYIATLNYSHTNNVITQIIKQNDATHTAYETSANLNTINNINLGFTIPIHITHWWISNNYANVFRKMLKGEISNGRFSQGITSFGFNSENTFTLPDDFKIELSGYYNSRTTHSVWVVDPQYSISGGIQKSFWHKQATLKLNINDLFNTQQYSGKLIYQNIDFRLHNVWESRRVGLTFTYNFGNKNIKSANHNSSIEDEQNRINKG